MYLTKNSARLAGALWLLAASLIGFSLVYVRPQVIAPGDAAATVNNLVAIESLFRAGIAGSVLGNVLFLFLAVLIFRSFKDVSKPVATICLTSLLTSAGIGVVNSLSNLGALLLVTNPDYANAFPPQQLNALAMIFLRMNNFGVGLIEIFTAIFLFSFGLLIVKSKYLPALIGIGMMVGSFGFPVNTFSKILIPQFYPAAFTQLAMLGGALSGLPPMLWLLIMGIDHGYKGTAPEP